MKKDEALFSVRHPGGQCRVAVPSGNLDALKDAIAKTCGVPVSQQKLSFGYPPRQLGSNEQLPAGGSVTVSLLDVSSVPSSSKSVVRRVVPANNSCLFACFAYCLLNRSRTIESSRQMRSLVAQEILKQSEVYSEPVLGKEPEHYVLWIKDDNAWGGSIEIAVLSAHFDVQVAVMDVQTTRMDLYEASPSAKKRMYLLYDGIHYDVICCSLGETEAQDECLFEVADAFVLGGAKDICQKLHDAHAFVDTSKFSLRCLVCGSGLAGEADAIAHATKNPGHTNFAEYAK